MADDIFALILGQLRALDESLDAIGARVGELAVDSSSFRTWRQMVDAQLAHSLPKISALERMTDTDAAMGSALGKALDAHTSKLERMETSIERAQGALTVMRWIGGIVAALLTAGILAAVGLR